MKTYYLTTPLYYVNDVPHIGHAYTTIAADVLARWKRLSGDKVFFLTGTDEHGAKIAKAAEDTQTTPKQFVDRISEEWKKTWSSLGITYDDFIRTSEPRHAAVVQGVFNKLRDTGDIYKGVYEGWYCIHDETNLNESELVNGNCPNCGRPAQRRTEESYFFKLSRFEQPLLDYYKSHPEFLSPSFRSSEIENFVKSGLKDLSVSRANVAWGVPVPFDKSHTVYVWFDALLNYITAPGYSVDGGSGDRFSSLWPADVHIVGKEIFRFHTVIWPAMLMALGLPLPKKVFAHGWWTVDGTKMSKSLGNVVDPNKMAAEYGVDAFRYFILREVAFGSDGDFSEKALLGRYNAELANNLGNLLSRTTTLLVKNFDGVVPPAAAQSRLVGDAKALAQRVTDRFDALAFGDVLDLVFDLMTRTNKYIDEKAPWKMGPEQKTELSEVLTECLHALRALALLLHPFMPGKTQDIWARLGETGALADAGPEWIRRMRAGEWPGFSPGQRVAKGEPLFQRKTAPVSK
jgi:methionyl-tRNA synthetase